MEERIYWNLLKTNLYPRQRFYVYEIMNRLENYSELRFLTPQTHRLS